MGVKMSEKYFLREIKLVTMFPYWYYTILKRFVVFVVVNSVMVRDGECFSPLWDSVKTQVFQEYEMNQRGQLQIVRSKLNDFKKKHELTVGENVKPNSRLILTCTAWYPSEWVYSGDADPTFTTNTTIENLGAEGQILPLDDVNGAKRYVATVVIGPRGIKQSDTGRYNCMTASPETGMKFKTLSAYYHVFVPGKSLFIRKRGGTILYDLRKSPARIPCGVTNPKVAVSLQKFQTGHLVNVNNESMLYHPISGFYPRQDIPGTYVCTAGFNKAFELLHFTLVPKLSGTASSAHIKHSSEEDLEWLFNSFKLGQSNRIHLSTKRPSPYEFKTRPGTTGPQKLTNQARPTTPPQIWKRPSEEVGNENDSGHNSPYDETRPAGVVGGSTYRPVYVLFAEDLNKIQSTTERPSGSGSGSASGSASASEESEEEAEGGDGEREGGDGDREGGDAEREGEEAEVEESPESNSPEEKEEPAHQFHFDPAQHYNPQGTPILFQQLLSTKRPTRPVPTAPASLRPSLHHQLGTTYLPFIDFLNPGSAVVKYKPVLNPTAALAKYPPYSQDKLRRTTTPKPYVGPISYDLHTNKLVYDITRSTSTRPLTTRRPTSIFKIPSLPTQRWPTTRKTKATTRITTTTTTTPPPPTIPDSVVCINSPCGANAKCFANTVYYHRQKETRREPACKCNNNFYGNPYLECHPPAAEETDYLSFNNTDIFSRRLGIAAVDSLEEGHLQNSDVFHSSNEPVIVDLRKK